ncbi:hypothetical protein M5D96_007685 [Drosophila gunungcola]|uniref:ACP54A1 n=1 Tax=Drosophila gunungcola TaxID=103775 RepID=A0A9Q0BPC9_9MUSC|nr:hypothetical protein M5D96_007685 [Drosophila gunungcola]
MTALALLFLYCLSLKAAPLSLSRRVFLGFGEGCRNSPF